MHRLFHSEIITQPPPEVVVQMGQEVMLAIVARGVGKLSYQWFRDSQPLPFGTTHELHLPAAQLAEQGIYTCRVSSEQGGSVLSDSTTVYGTTRPDRFCTFSVTFRLSSYRPSGSGSDPTAELPPTPRYSLRTHPPLPLTLFSLTGYQPGPEQFIPHPPPPHPPLGNTYHPPPGEPVSTYLLAVDFE